MALALHRLVTFFWLRCRLYYWWSALYCFLFERDADGSLPLYHSVESVEDVVGRLKWRRDRASHWWDTISKPAATYARHLLGRPAGDCEDIAYVAARMLADARDAGAVPEVERVGLLTVLCRGGGHTVAVFAVRESRHEPVAGIGEIVGRTWAHMGNWHGGRAQRGFARVEDAAKDIKAKLANRPCVGWCYVDENLKHVKYGSGADLE